MAGIAEIHQKFNSAYANTPTPLKEGIVIQDLVEKMSTEFTLDGNIEDLAKPFEEETSIEKLYNYEEYEPYLNHDCVRGSEEGNNTPFEDLQTLMFPITDDGLVRKRILREGSGDTVAPLAVVYYHYNSYLELDMVPFDSSNLRNQKKPVRGQVGIGSHYPGFELSLMSMKAGEKSQFLVHHNYAFGPLGAPPRIPPASTILLEIELFKFVDCGSVLEETTEISEKQGVSFAESYSAAKAKHLLGNDHFQSNNIVGALEAYKQAEKELLKCSMNNDEEEDKCLKLLLKIYVNMCICFNHPKIKSPERVCVTAREAFQVCHKTAHKSAKLLFNLAKAQAALNDFEKAKKNLKSAYKLEPNNKEINILLKEIEKKERSILEAEKITYKKALGLDSSQKKETVKAKEPAINPEVCDEFERVLREGLEGFIAARTARFDLPPGFTKNEIDICKKVCSEMGLKFNDLTICGKRSFFVTRS